MSRGVGRVFRAGMSGMAARLDPVQEALLTEPCILVNTKDEVLGQASKRECHQVESGTSLLHRAFSLFVFNSRDELLLQQRSDTKITFPGKSFYIILKSMLERHNFSNHINLES